jgi:hypothetical protein
METKVCSKCKEEKDVCEFHKSTANKSGLRNECKLCRTLTKKKYYEENKLNILENKKKYYLEKKDIILEKRMSYHYKNYELIKNYKKEYYQNNKIKFNEYNKFNYHNNILYKIGKLVRRRVFDYITKNNIKSIKTFEVVGCSPEFLKEFLENKFTEGMSWERMGKDIHIDHIIPLSSAKTEEEIYGLCHYTNLQPLWAEDNLRKGDKIL